YMNSLIDLKIAWLVPTAWFYWQPSLSELTRLFPNTRVFTGLFPGFAKGLERSLDIEIVGERKVVPVTQSGTSYGNNFTYLSPAIVNRLFRFKPQIVFSSSFGVWTILALLFKWIGHWKVVIAYEGSSPGVDYRNSMIRLALRRLMVNLADAYISNSEAGKDYLIKVLHAPENSVFQQPYEVPDQRTLAAVNESLVKVSPSSELTFEILKRPTFLFVGSVIARKGVQDLLEACKLLKASGVDDYSVLIVGDGEQRPALEQFTKTHDLQSVVTWVGQVDYSDMGTYFLQSDVFVLPTLEDTWGMVVLEAMLMGKPILCSTGAGASELVIEGKNGYRFASQDPKTLAETMGICIKNPEVLPEMGQYSRSLMERYSPQAAARFMSDIAAFVTRR
ncbi:MAG: glycosyltransferase family 4 protein, partial [Thermosynechococcaceae cyanobacterium]